MMNDLTWVFLPSHVTDGFLVWTLPPAELISCDFFTYKTLISEDLYTKKNISQTRLEIKGKLAPSRAVNPYKCPVGRNVQWSVMKELWLILPSRNLPHSFLQYHQKCLSLRRYCNRTGCRGECSWKQNVSKCSSCSQSLASFRRLMKTTFGRGRAVTKSVSSSIFLSVLQFQLFAPKDF